MLCTSTIGDAPVTVSVSVTPPTARSASIVALNEPESSTPSRFTWLNPGSANVTEYVPGGRLTMRKRPRSSLTAVRTFSMSAGLVASTVTPGNAAPEVSRVEPAIDAWAHADEGSKRITTATRSMPHRHLRITLASRSGLLFRKAQPVSSRWAFSLYQNDRLGGETDGNANGSLR